MSGKVNNQLIIYKDSLESFLEEMKHGRYLDEVPAQHIKAWVTAFTMSTSHLFRTGYVSVCGYAESGEPMKVKLLVFDSYYQRDMNINTKQLKEVENEIREQLKEEGFTVFEGQFDETGKTEGVWAS